MKRAARQCLTAAVDSAKDAPVNTGKENQFSLTRAASNNNARMKSNFLSCFRPFCSKRLICSGIVILLFVMLGTRNVNAQGPAHPSKIQIAHELLDEQLILAIQSINDQEASTGVSSVEWMDNYGDQYQDDIYYRKATISKLLSLLNDSNTHSIAKCYAATYLGMMHASEAATSLASNITIVVAQDSHHMECPPVGSFEPMSDALITIGTPSIFAVIQNLEESDDLKVRKPSLNVLIQIEGDKDIVRLRLQKALDAQSNTVKKARLQLAIKTLEGLNGHK